MTFSTGIFLTAIRFVEPLFRYLMLAMIYQYFGLILGDKEGESEEQKLLKNDALSSFLASSLNVELVYILLKSITTFSRKGQ